MKEQKLKEWSKMTIREKLDFNGFNGYVNNERFKDTSLFCSMNVRRSRDGS